MNKPFISDLLLAFKIPRFGRVSMIYKKDDSGPPANLEDKYALESWRIF